MAEATRVLEVVSAASTDVEIKLETHDFGGCSIDKNGEPLTAATFEACKSADAILLGKQKMHSPNGDGSSHLSRCHWRSEVGS